MEIIIAVTLLNVVLTCVNVTLAVQTRRRRKRDGIPAFRPTKAWWTESSAAPVTTDTAARVTHARRDRPSQS